MDLFGLVKGDKFSIKEQINKLGTTVQLKNSKNINIYAINGIKVDIVHYTYPWLHAPVITGHIKIAEITDIAAMKLSAITGRGCKKDFIDIFFLLKKFSLTQILDFYRKKYDDGSEFLVLKSLSCFEDAENDEFPNMHNEVDWTTIKNSIKKEIKKYFS